MEAPARIVYCHCAFAQVIPKGVKQEVLRRLADSGVDFECVPDLCEMSARRDPLMAQLSQLSEAGGVRIAACHARAVKGLFVAAGSPLPDSGTEIINMRVVSADAAVQSLLRPADSERAAGLASATHAQDPVPDTAPTESIA